MTDNNPAASGDPGDIPDFLKLLEFHPLANRYRLIEDEDFDKLVEDIKVNGVREPVLTLFEEKILDGRNRYRAARAAGKLHQLNVVRLPGGWDPVAFVISMNRHRRHLTAEEKRKDLEDLIKADPEKSDRQIAAAVNVDNKTAASVRADLERREEIPHVETRTDSKGRQQPASRPRSRTRSRRSGAAIKSDPLSVLKRAWVEASKEERWLFDNWRRNQPEGNANEGKDVEAVVLFNSNPDDVFGILTDSFDDAELAELTNRLVKHSEVAKEEEGKEKEEAAPALEPATEQRRF